jgi:hypothetical protein
MITQVWLFEHALGGRDWDDASRHADALMRGEWLQGPLTAAMIHTMTEPGALAPFVDRLAADPPWRRPFLSSLTWAAEDRRLPARALEMLAASKAPPTREEMARLVDRYVSDQDYQGARQLWVAMLSGERPAAIGVYNGAFSSLPALPPFNWRLNESEAASVEFGHDDDGRSALHLLARQASSAALAEEALVLPPGRYRLSLSARADPGVSGELFAWRLACAEGDRAPLAEIRQAGGPAGWRTFAADFQIPRGGCGAQWLRVFALPHEGFQPAEAWHRDLSVTKLAG